MPIERSYYEPWSKEDLITRLMQLESKNNKTLRPKRTNEPDFDVHAYPKRKIALKFCYLGSEYGGMEYQPGPTILPPVENVIFDALSHVKLIDPKGGLEGCGWERCGRTDKGVSAAQQVISLWVRSAIGAQNPPSPVPESSSEEATNLAETKSVKERDALDDTASVHDDTEEIELDGDLGLMGDWDEPPMNTGRPPLPKEPSEIAYLTCLNNILPPSIRILAWSPVTPTFSARFNTKYRHYKYFFSTDGLDISIMQEAAKRLVGEHDFQNMCKIDPAKQLTSHHRRILSATITQVDGSNEMFVLDLVGTAFLYNQVRHIMAVLFLIGTGLEKASLIPALMNSDPKNPIKSDHPGEPDPPLVETKPEYQMADALPLVLWECAYHPSDVNWQIDSDAPDPSSSNLTGSDLAGNVYDFLKHIRERSLITNTLDAHFLAAAAQYHKPASQFLPLGRPDAPPMSKHSVLSIPLGGATYRRSAKHRPILERSRMQSVEVVNERWRLGKGKKYLDKKMEKRAAWEASQQQGATDDTRKLEDADE